MVSLQDKYDSAFLGILQNEGKIPQFLDTIFSFLYRRTDFFRHMRSPDDRMGFPPGVASKLVNDAFERYHQLARKDDKEKEKRQKQSKEQLLKVKEPPKTSTVVTETAVSTSQAGESAKPQQGSAVEKSPVNQENSGDKMNLPSRDKDNVAANNSYETKTVKTAGDGDTKSAAEVSRKDEEDEDPELTKLQQIYQANPESYNGAVRDKYSWSQSITDLDVRIQVPSHIKKGKDVRVSFTKKHLSMSCKGESGAMEELVNGELCWDINQEESMWTLVPGEHVHVNLEKIQERWWDALLTDEPKISVRKIDPSRPMTDLDDEAQAKIEEMMYNEQRKRMGLPQSHEMKTHEMLKKAWDAEGSPFKGQPFDPSKLNITPPGGGGGTFN